MNHKKQIFTYRLCLVLIGLVGVAINTELKPAMFLYYTTLSNVLCIVYFAFALTQSGKALNQNLKGAVTLAITVTMLIYWGVLAPYSFHMTSTLAYCGTYMVHLIVPLMTIFDWFFFDQKGRFSKKAPLYWLLIPLVYYGFTVIAAQFQIVYPLTGKHYPYFFIDANMIGWGMVAAYVLGLTLFFLFFGYGFYWLDKKLAK
ncbi:Pr6Pr family membrane protein [Fructobacillus sp. M158]|uniref:Pr6Pr family membrane protein n=1 Tax=Fructobacillus parabroussonetiae TaxID=2713174 RepID=UPI00200B48AE|nr:Pr6Pr family membrane protein [Fructobacillus parabroussonetiae]MCK8617392.1 Pr6Pr family membrane protein [Fructobacillus parabroussonetiae]